jgi:hypothetical protein
MTVQPRRPKKANYDRCESPAERAIFGTLNTIAIQYKLDFDNQVEVGSQGSDSNVCSTREEFCRSKGWYYDGNERDWNDYTWESEIWRIDFVLNNNFIKLAIEIDGKEWHKDVEFDSMRDKELHSYGYQTIHFPASHTIRGIHIIRNSIFEKFGIAEAN